jgi:nicotinamide mononucleotide transporter PnuC
MFTSFRDLTRFERGLWLASLIGVVIAYALSDGGDVLTMIASLIGVTAVIFVAKGYVLGQALSVFFAVFYGIISFFFRYYGEMITYLCMSGPMALAAVISWLRHPYKGSREVTVNRLKRWQVAVMLVAAAAVTVAFYFILRALGTANLLFSTISVTTSFIASYLTALRSPYYAIGYALNDVVLIVLWVLATMQRLSYLPMVLCFMLFLVLDLYGFYNWRRMQRKQEG